MLESEPFERPLTRPLGNWCAVSSGRRRATQCKAEQSTDRCSSSSSRSETRLASMFNGCVAEMQPVARTQQTRNRVVLFVRVVARLVSSAVRESGRGAMRVHYCTVLVRIRVLRVHRLHCTALYCVQLELSLCGRIDECHAMRLPLRSAVSKLNLNSINLLFQMIIYSLSYLLCCSDLFQFEIITVKRT